MQYAILIYINFRIKEKWYLLLHYIILNFCTYANYIIKIFYQAFNKRTNYFV